MTRTRMRMLVLFLATPLFLACDPKPPPPAAETPPVSAPSSLSPEQAADARRTLVKWYECEECNDGELDAVLRLGPDAIPSLAATLNGGLAPAAREKLVRALHDRYAELRSYAQLHPDPPFDVAESAWVDGQVANEEARYRVRAAQALARFGGPEARRALAEALATPLRPDVEGAVRKSLDAAGGPP